MAASSRFWPVSRPGQLVLDFPWKAPLGAAVFHRGGAIWIVFDAAARLDLSALPHGSPLFAAVAPVQGPDYTALRFDAPAGESVAASAQGGRLDGHACGLAVASA